MHARSNNRPNEADSSKIHQRHHNGEKIVSLIPEEDKTTCSSNNMGHKTDRNDGHVYRNDKKSHQKWYRTSHAKHQKEIER